MEALSIGRAPDNDLVLNNSKVSRYHARLYKRSDRWVLVDLQSTHGTSVNGTRLSEPIKLRPGDSILVSEVELLFDGSSIRTADGGIKVSLVGTAHSAAEPGSKQVPGKKTASLSPGVLVAIGLVVVFLLFTAIIVHLTGSTVDVSQEVIASHEQEREPEPDIEFGTIDYDGGLYKGWLRDGVPHGQGTLTYSTRSRSSSFYSVFIERGTRDEVYEGEWQFGRKHGYGTLTKRDGTVLEGYWENDTYIGPRGN